MPLVSVVMPVYNGESFLQEAIDSVLCQTYSNIELIIVNDGSTDRTEDIILSYSDPRIHYHKNEQNLHIVASLNKGFRIAKGYFIARMDADDICMPQRIECQVNYMQKHTDVDVCGTWAIKINEDGGKIGCIRGFTDSKMIACASLFTTPLVHPSVMFRRSIVKEEMYNPMIQGAGQDLELWSRLSLEGRVLANIPSFLMKYRWYDGNVSSKHIEKGFDLARKTLLPSVELFLKRHIATEEFLLHRLSYMIKAYGVKNDLFVLDEKLMDKEKLWIEELSCYNNQYGVFDKASFDALLFLRWVICCVAIGKKQIIPSIRIKFYSPSIISKLIRYAARF